MRILSSLCAMLLVAVAPARADTQAAPAVDYHQHLVSATFAPIVGYPERDGAALIAQMDAAGIERAVVLSVGYSLADERKGLPEPDVRTREENDWTAAQVAAGGGRLIGFCSANPQRDAALAELERCLALPGMAGIKLHLGNSGISLRDAEHYARIAAIFDLAQRRGAALSVHMRARGGLNYGAEDARLFLQLLARAPDVDVIAAHLGGAGPGYPDQADEVIAVFVEAVAAGDPRVARLFVDLATVFTAESTPGDATLIARRIRELGPQRVLYGSDLVPPGVDLATGWRLIADGLGLTPEEVRTIAERRLGFVR